jgi:predicted Zn-ribbon and HTH transcriptional regulator
MAYNKEELEAMKKALTDYRAKKQQPQPTQPETLAHTLEIENVQQEIDIEIEPENICSNCGYKFDGRLETCPKCKVEFDWD